MSSIDPSHPGSNQRIADAAEKYWRLELDNDPQLPAIAGLPIERLPSWATTTLCSVLTVAVKWPMILPISTQSPLSERDSQRPPLAAVCLDCLIFFELSEDSLLTNAILRCWL